MEELYKEDVKREEEHHYDVKIRDMHAHDVAFFENNAIKILSDFCLSFKKIGISKHSISTSTINYHATITADEFNDEYDKE